MLQQTQAARIAERFPAFMRHFPTPRDLAAAPTAAVLAAWSGLGYNRRALALQRAARVVAGGVGRRTSRRSSSCPASAPTRPARLPRSHSASGSAWSTRTCGAGCSVASASPTDPATFSGWADELAGTERPRRHRRLDARQHGVRGRHLHRPSAALRRLSRGARLPLARQRGRDRRPPPAPFGGSSRGRRGAVLRALAAAPEGTGCPVRRCARPSTARSPTRRGSSSWRCSSGTG